MENKKKTIAFVIVISVVILLLIGIIIFLIYKDSKNNNPQEVQNLKIDTTATMAKEEQKEKVDLSSRNIYFAGFEDMILREGDKINLENLPENEDFLMEYSIYEVTDGKDELLHKTDLIPSGEQVSWIPSESLEKGEHQISFVGQPYLQQGETFLPLTAGNNIVTITLN